MPAIVVDREHILEVCRVLRDDPALQFALLVDVTAVDYLPASPRFEIVYLLACLGAAYATGTAGAGATAATEGAGAGRGRRASSSVVPMFPGRRMARSARCSTSSASSSTGHPDLRRILMPDDWQGHPLRKDYPVQIRKDTAVVAAGPDFRRGVRGEHPRSARAASRTRESLGRDRRDRLRIRERPDHSMPEIRTETMTVNMGPQHPSTHGVLRLVLELDGENIVSLDPTIGFLHTGIEKTAEQKKWQQVDPARRADGLPRPAVQQPGVLPVGRAAARHRDRRFPIASSGSAC